MTLVVDASLIVAALVDGGSDGTWADALLASEDLAAPHLMPVEATNILRRSALAGHLSAETASAAHRDLLDLRVALYAHAPFAERIWGLRENVTAYDAWYVAVAEALDAPLASLDRTLSRASGPRCSFRTPPPR